ncbi:MAG: sel1 repeat family protein [Oxalobacter sp.]|nr:sel1 repeat family protein [Oxalobacter sp.]
MRVKAGEKKGVVAMAAGIAVLLLSLFCVMPVSASSASERNAEELAQMRKDLPEMIKKAASGKPEDQFILGVVYAAGIEGKPDYKKALYWYEKAASQGEETACYMAYVLYVEGMGTKCDLAGQKSGPGN